MYCCPLPVLSSITPSTLPLVRHLLSPQNPPALFPDEAPIRPMKPDPGLLMEPVKYHRFENPCVINIPDSPSSMNTRIQYVQKYHIDVHGRSRHMTHSNEVAYDEVGNMGKRENHLDCFIHEQISPYCSFSRPTTWHFSHILLKAVGSSVRITIIILLLRLPWEVFPNGCCLLRMEPYFG